MKRKMKQIFITGLGVLLLFSVSAVPAFANSAQMSWEGIDSTGAIITEKNSPIIVEKEVLTFDINELPKNHYQSKQEIEAYNAKVTAEYTFYNPSDLTVTAKLLFPFGHLPTYADVYYDEDGERIKFDDTSRFDITVNGEPVEKNIRHTFSHVYDQFVLERDTSWLTDGFVEDKFYSPDLTVTRYKFKISGVDTEKFDAADAAFDLPKGLGNYRVYLPDQSGSHTQKDGDLRVATWVQKNDREFDMYVFGTPFETMPEWKIYENGGVEDKEVIAGTVSLTGTETMTFKDFALAGRVEESPVLEHDWYNAVVAEMNLAAESSEHPIVRSWSVSSFDKSLMRWYEYEITLAPGERITNAVTAPIYPGIDMSYEPDIFEYSYLLSPAKTWKSFGELEIVINTPYYLTECVLEGFTKTENGYSLKLDGLPEGELEFTLSTAEKPYKAPSPYLSGIDWPATIALVVGIAVVLAGGITAFVLIRKKKKGAARNESNV